MLRRSISRWFVQVICAALILILIVPSLGLSEPADDDLFSDRRVQISKDDLNPTPDLPSDWLNILLLGTDDRSATTETGRSDATLIASFNTSKGEIKLSSIARDTFVDIPNMNIKDRINTAQRYGGPNLAMKTVNTLFGMNITKYIMINMADLKKIVDVVGGVTINLEIGEGGYISKRLKGVHGPTRLNGEEALAFARIRHLDNDFGRTNRHRRLLIAIYEEARKDISTEKVLKLAQALLPIVTTNMNFLEFTQLGLSFMSSSPATIDTLEMPIDGSFEYGQVTGRSVLITDIGKNKAALHDFVYGE